MGKVQYFVKAVPLPIFQRHLEALGLPTQPQRFAIVDAYLADNVQHGMDLSAEDYEEWVTPVQQACVSAGLCRDHREFKNMLRTVEQFSELLAVAKDHSRVVLRHPGRQGRGLETLAIPLSSQAAEWYSASKGPDSVEPVVRIQPSKKPLQRVRGERDPNSERAKKAMDNTLMYFVPPYARSGSGYYL